MPRLRETLADSGITLGNASVSTGGFHDPAQAQQDPRAYGTTLAAPTADASGVLRGERLLSHSLGLVDIFA